MLALIELHREPEALRALDHALALSPNYPRFLNERGFHFQEAKDWPHALETYKAAEENVKLLTEPTLQIGMHTKALRGQAYALVEMGDLDAAERKYRESLALDPGDDTAKRELEYIKGLRAKPRP